MNLRPLPLVILLRLHLVLLKLQKHNLLRHGFVSPRCVARQDTGRAKRKVGITEL